MKLTIEYFLLKENKLLKSVFKNLFFMLEYLVSYRVEMRLEIGPSRLMASLFYYEEEIF